MGDTVSVRDYEIKEENKAVEALVYLGKGGLHERLIQAIVFSNSHGSCICCDTVF